MVGILDIINRINSFEEVAKQLNFKIKESSKVKSDFSYKFDIVLLGSTQQEFESILTIIDQPSILNIENDNTIYYKGCIQGKINIFSVIIPVPTDMGIATAAIITTKCISLFSPSHIFMIGIAAGIKSVCKIGDVIIADKSINYNRVFL